MQANKNSITENTPIRKTMKLNGDFDPVLNNVPKRFGSDMVDRGKSLQVLDQMLIMRKERQLKKQLEQAEATRKEDEDRIKKMRPVKEKNENVEMMDRSQIDPYYKEFYEKQSVDDKHVIVVQ